MGKYSYIVDIDGIVTNMSSEMRILYLQSDYPDILDVALDEDRGASGLRNWLQIEQYKDFDAVEERYLARPLTAVYEEHSSHGVLKDSDYFKRQMNIKDKDSDPVYIRPGNKVFYRYPVKTKKGKEFEYLSFEADIKSQSVGRRYDKTPIDLRINPIHDFLVGENCVRVKFEDVADGRSSLNEFQVTDDNCLFFYLLNADALEQWALARMMQAFLQSKRLYPRAKLIMTGSTNCIPKTLMSQVQLIRLGSPKFEDIRQDLEKKLTDEDGFRIPVKDDEEKKKKIDGYTQTLCGLTYLQLQAVYAYFGDFLAEELIRDPGALSDAVWRQKKQENAKDSTLKYELVDKSPDVVGIGGFTHWLNENLEDLADAKTASKYGLKPPRGAILAGVPGTGKSQLAKQMAYRWRYFDNDSKPVSLIEFNIGNLSSKNYGESEARMAHFLSRISEQAPAILFIDEVEKTFYHNKKDNQEMHEVKKQQMGMLLAWLQEHEENIFTFMTSNDISILPPELIRSGRLSERFFFFLPNYVELMSMLYAFLYPMIGTGIFDSRFVEDIGKVYEKIDAYSRKYGFGTKKDNAKLDEELSAAVKSSLLRSVLIKLTRYAANLEVNSASKEKLDAPCVQWDDLIKTDDPYQKDSHSNLRTPFMTGADMKELVRKAVLWLRKRKPIKPDSGAKWTGSDFAEALEACCCCSEFMPYGQSNMKKLVELYLECDYREASDHPMLPKSEFNTYTGKFARNGQYICGTAPDNLYDQYLQKVLMKEIEKHAREKIREEEHLDRQEVLEKAHVERLGYEKQQIERQRKNWADEDAVESFRKRNEDNSWIHQELQLQKFANDHHLQKELTEKRKQLEQERKRAKK